MIEFLLALGGVTGLGGIGTLWVTRRARRAHVIETRTAWVRAGERVRFGPVGVISFGPLPQAVYTHRVFGAVGLVNDALVFEGHRDHQADMRLPLERIQRLDLCTVPVRAHATITHRRALCVHSEAQDGWRVATLIADDLHEIASAIHRERDLPLHDAGPARSDFGPADSTRMVQDVYGEWFADREGALYLAPDRLIFGWHDAILLQTVQRLDVLAQGTWRDRLPRAEGLLRVEHVAPDEIHIITGFVVQRADDWANAIQRRISEPIPVQSGRKKKIT